MEGEGRPAAGRAKGKAARARLGVVPDRGAIEARRALVAARVLSRLSIGQIARELAALPEGERPADCSRATVGRDVLALRREWAAVRVAALDGWLAEEVARLNALEAALWARAAEGVGEAIDRCLAIQRQRVQLLLPRGGPLMTGGAPGVGPIRVGVEGAGAGGSALRVTVEYVDDWRAALSRVAGALEVGEEAGGDGGGGVGGGLAGDGGEGSQG